MIRLRGSLKSSSASLSIHLSCSSQMSDPSEYQYLPETITAHIVTFIVSMAVDGSPPQPGSPMSTRSRTTSGPLVFPDMAIPIGYDRAGFHKVVVQHLSQQQLVRLWGIKTALQMASERDDDLKTQTITIFLEAFHEADSSLFPDKYLQEPFVTKLVREDWTDIGKALLKGEEENDYLEVLLCSESIRVMIDTCLTFSGRSRHTYRSPVNDQRTSVLLLQFYACSESALDRKSAPVLR